MAEAHRSRLAWIGVVGLLAGLAACLGVIAHGRDRVATLERENADLRQAARDIDELRRENQRLQRIEVDHDELERYRKQAEEVHKLRGQYQEWQRLQNDLTQLRQENERLRTALSGSAVGGTPAPASRGVWIGIGLRLVTDPGTGSQGTAVASVIPGGPAANSGLRPGDLIVAVNGRPMTALAQIKEEIRTKAVGAAILVDVVREGTRLQFSAAAEPLPAFD
jgi:C-terminal processing protease CtpA/Prc